LKKEERAAKNEEKAQKAKERDAAAAEKLKDKDLEAIYVNAEDV